MDAVRRTRREQAFRIRMQVVGGLSAGDGVLAARAFTDLADACIRTLAPAALEETVARLGGAFPGEVAVIALRQMWLGRDDGQFRPGPDDALQSRG